MTVRPSLPHREAALCDGEGIYGQTSVKHTKKEDFIHVLPRHLSQKKICVRSRELEVLAASLPHKFFKPHSFPMTRTCESIESSRKLRIYVVALIVSSSKRASKNLINRFHVPWGNLRQSLVYQGRRAPRVQQRGVTNVMGWWLTITFQSGLFRIIRKYTYETNQCIEHLENAKYKSHLLFCIAFGIVIALQPSSLTIN